MKSIILPLSIGASLFSLASAAGTLQLGIKGRQDGVAAGLRKRTTSGTVQTNIQNDALAVSYYVDVTIGTPPQKISLIVDTGSSDIWTVETGNAICQTTTGGCSRGTFDPTKSSTYDVNGAGQFQASYVDGSSTTGDYFLDTFGIGGASVKSMQLGLATNSSIPQGIMGIAFDTAEGGGTVQYPNLVDTMVNESIIATQAYSLWLDDRAARTGSILFGGVDTGKFEGNMVNIAMYPSSDSGIVDRFSVAFTSLSITSPSGTDTLTPTAYGEAVVLDSGTTLTYLPDDLATGVYNEVGAVYYADLQTALCDCYTGSVQGTLNFGFAGANGVTIKVPMSELVSPLYMKDGSQGTFTNGQPACIFGIGPLSSLGSGSPILFGDTVLRSAYVVYDLQNFRIGLAPTKFNSTDTNVVAFPSFGASIPSATTVVDESAVTQTASKGVIGQVPAQTAAPSGTNSAVTSSGMFTGNAGPGFATAATQTTAATGTSKPKKSPGGRDMPFPWHIVSLMALTMGLVTQSLI